MIAAAALCKKIRINQDSIDIRDIISEIRVSQLPMRISNDIFRLFLLFTQSANEEAQAFVTILSPDHEVCFRASATYAGPAYFFPLKGIEFLRAGAHAVEVEFGGETTIALTFNVNCMVGPSVSLYA